MTCTLLRKSSDYSSFRNKQSRFRNGDGIFPVQYELDIQISFRLVSETAGRISKVNQYFRYLFLTRRIEY